MVNTETSGELAASIFRIVKIWATDVSEGEISAPSYKEYPQDESNKVFQNTGNY
jgi:hypothetical protein